MAFSSTSFIPLFLQISCHQKSQYKASPWQFSSLRNYELLNQEGCSQIPPRTEEEPGPTITQLVGAEPGLKSGSLASRPISASMLILSASHTPGPHRKLYFITEGRAHRKKRFVFMIKGKTNLKSKIKKKKTLQ